GHVCLERAPRNRSRERDLQVMRGLPRRDLAAILEAVQRARELPLEQCPLAAEREQDIPQIGLVVTFLTAVLGDLCARERLAPNLVASTADVRMLVRAQFQGGPLPA